MLHPHRLAHAALAIIHLALAAVLALGAAWPHAACALAVAGVYAAMARRGE